MLSFRLFVTEQNRAGLNLYATRPRAFTDQSIATGAMFAAYASMALLAAARHDTTNHLTRALETNREIGVAMGILMANGKLTNQQAFDQLRTASQNLNRKLHDIAADVALTGQLPRSRSKRPSAEPSRRSGRHASGPTGPRPAHPSGWATGVPTAIPTPGGLLHALERKLYPVRHCQRSGQLVPRGGWSCRVTRGFSAPADAVEPTVGGSTEDWPARLRAGDIRKSQLPPVDLDTGHSV